MKRIFVFLVIALSAMNLFGQNPLPNDPTVRKGKLENGLTYYIKHNDKPAQRAEFYLATNVGAIQETPDQDGLAHFLEHMCFNGTKNFPGKSILEYLQSIGAEFGRNINASTGFEQTQYMLNNIPIVRESIIDTCLLIIHDYSHFVTCAPEEIDAERGVIIEERRTRRDANWRIFEKSLPYYYGDCKYATCTLIGSQENLETFKPESLTNFYHTWYRPDMQAVIVVGDVDVDQIEQKIKNVFSDIPAPENPKPKDVIKVPDNTDPVVGIITDPEATVTNIEVLWKSEAAPEELNSTDVGMMMDLLKNIIYMVMQERFTDITAKPDAPFISASLGIGNMCETMEVVMGNISCKDGEGLSAFKAFMTEVEKMKRYGFTDAEITRAKDNILSFYEKAAEGADTRKNEEFVRDYINNFFDNYPYMDPKQEYETAKAILSQLNAAIVNQVAGSIITDENLVVIYSAPEKEGLSHPVEQNFIDIINETRAAEIEANAEETSNEPLLDAAALKGSRIKKEKESIYGSTEWILKNGVTVVVLPTEYKKDQVLIDICKDGGRSLIATEDLPSFEDNIFGLFLNNTGVSKFPSTTLSKMLAGKNLRCTPYINNIRHGVSATCMPKDIETALQLAYLYYTDPRFDQDEYQIGIEQLNAILPNLKNQPNYKFSETFTKTIYGNNPRKMTINEDIVAKANLATIERVYRELFKDAAGARVVIVGNVDLETLKPLVEKYIGSLPKGKKATEWVDTNEDIVPGEIENHFKADMQTPKSTVIQLYSASVPASVKNEVILEAANYILDMIYTQTLREEEGGTYGAGTSMAIQWIPKERATIQVYFDTNPTSAEKLCELAVKGLKDLAEQGPTAEQFSKAVENLKKNIPESHINNSYWKNKISFWYNYGIDGDKEYEQAVNELTSEDIKTLLSSILSQNNFIEVMMSPDKTAERQ